MWARHDRNAQHRGFEQVVTADRNQATRNKGNVTRRIEHRYFTHRVTQEYGCIASRLLRRPRDQAEPLFFD